MQRPLFSVDTSKYKGPGHKYIVEVTRQTRELKVQF